MTDAPLGCQTRQLGRREARGGRATEGAMATESTRSVAVVRRAVEAIWNRGELDGGRRAVRPRLRQPRRPDPRPGPRPRGDQGQRRPVPRRLPGLPRRRGRAAGRTARRSCSAGPRAAGVRQPESAGPAAAGRGSADGDDARAAWPTAGSRRAGRAGTRRRPAPAGPPPAAGEGRGVSTGEDRPAVARRMGDAAAADPTSGAERHGGGRWASR